MALVAILIVLVVIFAVAGIGLWLYLKKLNKNLSDKSLNPDLQSATDMLPFVDIIDVKKGEYGVTDLGDEEYRAYIRVGSINYQLRSPKEQDIIEMAYRRLLNITDFPWVYHIQTHNINNELWDREIDEDVTKALNQFRNTPAYQAIRRYYSITKATNEKERRQAIANGLNQKEIRKYIVIPYNGAADVLPDATPEERKQNAINKLSNRVDQMIGNLSDIGLQAEYLSRKQIIQLYVSEYNRDSNLFANEVADGTLTTVYADNPTKYYLNSLNDPERLYVILNETKNRIQTEIVNLNRVDEDTKEISQDVDEYIDKKIQEIQEM